MFKFDNIEKALEDIKNGKNILVVDDENRENEGDLICAGQFATPENINFMATHAKGLICMPMSTKYTEKFMLNQMVNVNTDNHSTAFTVSIDHIDTTTGISAFERSLTVLKMFDKDAKAEDFRRPGHMFPLEAKSGGVLVRNGHTEATVDLCELAGFEPVGLCCEIMDDDGKMMRLPKLIEFSKKHNLTFITIKSLVEYRKKKEFKFNRVTEANLPTKYGNFKIFGYENNNGEHHIALKYGEVSNGDIVPVRVHSECLTGDVFGSAKCDCGEQLDKAMKEIVETGNGVLIYLRQEGRGIGLINKIKAYNLQDNGFDTVDANLELGFDADLRNYYPAVDILEDLGISKIRLFTNNPDKIKGFNNTNIEVVERIHIEVAHKPQSERYMKVKKEKMGHILNFK